MKRRNYIKNLPILLLFACSSLTILAQDIHYSQVGNSPQNVNSGLIGAFDGNDRFIVNVRDQWRSIVPYFQMAGAWDHRFMDKQERPTPFAMGLNVNFDKAGDLGLSWTSVGLGGSFAHRLIKNKDHFLSFGLNGSVNNRSFNPADATFDAEYELKNGRPQDVVPSETFDNSSKWFGDIGGGVNLRLQKDSSRTHFDVGVGMFHFAEPKISFADDPSIRLNRRLAVNGTGTVQLASKFDLLLFAMVQFQGDYQETVLGAGGLIHLNQTKTKELALQFGGVYRLGDAIAPWVGLRMNAWQFHLSYDFNTSPFRNATNGFGGPELTVIYIIKNVPPMEYCELCPKYM